MRRMYSLKQLQEIADARVEALVEGGQLDNAKPIYCHPIAIKRDTSGNNIRLTCLLFNNDATPFTLETFKDFIDELSTNTDSLGKIMCSGAYLNSTYVIIASYITKISGTYFVVGLQANDGASANISSTSFNSVFPADCTFEDGVNKIN